MDSYIYKTHNNEFGYFQIDDGVCYTFPMDSSKNYVEKGEWEKHFRLERLGSPNAATFTLSQQQLLDGMSYFISRNSTKGTITVVDIHPVNDTGSYFFRTNRGEPLLSDHQIKSTYFLDEVRAYENITESLLDIFRTLEPERNNFTAYGNKIRELLIISCTEVEYLLQKFLTDSNKQPKYSFYNTGDYVWSLPILKLNLYSVSAMLFPGLGNLTPFLNWNSSAATQSLAWYDAYNKVKHDRGGTKDKATLEALLNSIAAIHILLEAQYGKELFEYRFQYTFRTIFQTQNRPTWSMHDFAAPLLTKQKIEWLTPKKHP
ncbi:hypothetical protein I7V27_21645 [Lelliottia amnigena]|uniref:Uncharacterized protein n=1 Tax=Lelliottia amnigena TaxID=61646 RepID=A0AAP2AH53_LELAM|nr:hypothetical protein [Lelliottia amnigena]MBL5901130.1 hypothetical protein [Lelliottia amnigena]MBL5937028.1 hypothetical protein [Lelliottia amnigena]